MRVAFQGMPGAYGELAVRRHFDDAHAVPCPAFPDVLEAVATGTVNAGVLPVENSLVGAVPGVAALLQDDRVGVEAELWLPIHHCLLGSPNATLDTVQSVLSHPVALAQCRHFFARRPNLREVEWFDTAGAAAHVAGARDPSLAAIASEHAARHYDLTILATNLEDRPDNRTRFVVISARAAARP